ncbi:MAG: hypothetical protein H2055_01980 [Sphingopyxis sp.]|nr:hypothetical protein [Sphingopyxis sp.]
MTQRTQSRQGAAITPYQIEIRARLLADKGAPLDSIAVGEIAADLRQLGSELWLIVRRPGKGGVALRAARWVGDATIRRLKPAPGDHAIYVAASDLGEHRIVLRAGAPMLPFLRVITSFRPSAPTILPYLPRDLFPLDASGDPLAATGCIHAVQRGPNSALLYFEIDEPSAGSFFYFQNLTALNDYCAATATTPDQVVGGIWPELGLLLPTCVPHDTEDARPLTANTDVVLSDAILLSRPDAACDERDRARHFLQMLGGAYQLLDLPPTAYRDWIGRAHATLRDLDAAPEATIRHYGHRYVHPYTNAEYPDVMVQMSIVEAIHQWGKWTGEPHPLEAEFKAGLSRFYDRKLGTLRRYLPNVGADKDADAVDSWYLYHPLLNLGKLALDGDRKARTLFLQSLDYGIRAAHHFHYKWPIQYKVEDFTVITESAGADGRGQTDVGGIYAWVMLEAFALTDEKQYLDEARAAIDAAIGLGFGVNYQANLTAWGAAACMRLWRITDRDVYREQSYVYLASFFHHCEIWESRLDHAVHYHNFLGATALQDAPYMAIYECFDSFAAFEHYLADSGPDLEPAARMLISEYCKYALDRAWFYYPDALPRDAIADEQRSSNGHIDRKLSFPLEDLYPDGQPAGQVGQEIYGAGAAMIFATRAFHRVEEAPFLLYCDHFVRAIERTDERTLTLTLDGGETCSARLSVCRRKRRKLSATRVATSGGDLLRPQDIGADRIDYHVPASGRLVLQWD